MMKKTNNAVIKNDLPYERFLSMGPASLSESELLAIILRTGTRDISAVEVARKVLSLSKYPRCGLLGLYDLSVEELASVKGIGPVKAVKLKALAELSMRMHTATAAIGFNAASPASVAGYFMEQLRHLERENVVLACLDTKGTLIAQKRLSEGSVNLSLISPRIVFIEALTMHAVNIILLHNHPSGDPSPSLEDISLTEDIGMLGDKLGIRLLDHIIIGDNRYYSFEEHGLMNPCS